MTEEKFFPTRKIEKLVQKYSDNLSLDAGCGWGSYFKSFKGRVVGLDIAIAFLKAGKERLPTNKEVHFVLGDLRSLPFKEGVFDFVLCSSVLEHLYEDGARKAIHELERVTNGRLKSTCPTIPFLWKF